MTRFTRTAPDIALAALASGAILALATALPMGAAEALPIFAQETGLPCGQCHIDPGGGGPRTAFGRAFAANGYRLPGESRHRYGDSGSPRHGGYGGMMGGYGGNGGYGPGMMGGYGSNGGYGPGMMGGYGSHGGYGPGMMGPGMMGW